MLHESSGVPYLIEINPRCTQLGHLVLPDQGDLAGLLCARLGAPVAGGTQQPLAGDLVAFFPQALAWSADSPYLQMSTQDIPWSEPRLVRELLRESWPDRRWLSRVYHFLRPRSPAATRRIEQRIIDLHLSRII
jgi:hypothetical protein